MQTIINKPMQSSPLLPDQNDRLAIEHDLKLFLNLWDEEYKQGLVDLPLFQSEVTSLWTLEQKQFFIRVLYHLRGHFADLLFYMGNFAPNIQAKKMIIENVCDEFGMNGTSHEKLYFIFAQHFDVDLKYELLDEVYYLPFAREYIKGQLKWMRDHDWAHRAIAFAAIERLDNVDYVNLRDIAISMGTPKSGLTFFNVHINADHFTTAFNTCLVDLWRDNKQLVKDVFYFIRDYQHDMFKKLSQEMQTL